MTVSEKDIKRLVREYNILHSTLEDISMPDCAMWGGCGKRYSRKSKCPHCEAKIALENVDGCWGMELFE